MKSPNIKFALSAVGAAGAIALASSSMPLIFGRLRPQRRPEGGPPRWHFKSRATTRRRVGAQYADSNRRAAGGTGPAAGGSAT